MTVNRFRPRGNLQDLERRRLPGNPFQPPTIPDRLAETRITPIPRFETDLGRLDRLDFTAIRENLLNQARTGQFRTRPQTIPQQDDLTWYSSDRLYEQVNAYSYFINPEPDVVVPSGMAYPRAFTTHKYYNDSQFTNPRKELDPDKFRGIQIGGTSRLKSAKFKNLYLSLMAFNRPYIGAVFSYSMNSEQTLGYWSVCNIPVIKVDLQTMKITQIKMPNADDMERHPGIQSRSRFLIRQFGLSAIRGKGHSVVGTISKRVKLSPGETWEVPSTHVESLIGTTGPLSYKNLQSKLFDNLPHISGPRTKPVKWVDINGRAIPKEVLPVVEEKRWVYLNWPSLNPELYG